MWTHRLGSGWASQDSPHPHLLPCKPVSVKYDKDQGEGSLCGTERRVEGRCLALAASKTLLIQRRGIFLTSYFIPEYSLLGALLVAQMVKNPPVTQETPVWRLGWEDPLEKGMATHSSILAWRIPWTEEFGGLQSMGSQRVGCEGVTNTY